MVEGGDVKQIPIKLTEQDVRRLDIIAAKAGTNRHSLMLSIIRAWLAALNEVKQPYVFYIAVLLRERELQLNLVPTTEHEFSGRKAPEKPIPVKLNEDQLFQIARFSNLSHLTRHEFMKIMIITGKEELDNETCNTYDDIEKVLTKNFCTYLERADDGFRAYLNSKGKEVNKKWPFKF